MSEQVKQEGNFKVKAKKPKNLSKPNAITKVEIPKADIGSQGEVIPEVTKVDLSKPVEQEEVSQVQEITADTVEEVVDNTDSGSILQEITDEEEVVEVAKELKQAVQENQATGKPLPENIEKVVDFMKKTGGSLEDYVRLNADYSNVDNDTLLREYYKQAKSHLDSSEINFMIEDNFAFDEEVDEEREIRKKKLAYKEEVAKARKHLDGLKSQYYEEIKLRPGTTQDQQKAMDFFNRYNEEQNTAQQQHEDFKSNTKDYFSQDFKGFDINVGEKKFRYGVKNPSEVATKQSNITNTIKKFLDDKGNVKDVKGYHKAMYAAENVDSIAKHFYEQGKSDATKDLVAKSKNITEDVRPSPTGDVFVGGLKVKAISGLDSSKLKIKTRKFN